MTVPGQPMPPPPNGPEPLMPWPGSGTLRAAPGDRP